MRSRTSRNPPALAPEERKALDEYERGWIDGLWAYAWWKDGVVYVGTTGTTYAQAVDRFLRERRSRGCAATPR